MLVPFVDLTAQYNSIKSDIDRYFMIVLLLELGKLAKGKIASSRGNSLNEFIELGSGLYIKNAEIKSEDLAYYLSIKECISNFTITGSWKDTLIIRDSTGSSFQHWGVLLGIKESALEKLNLRGSV